MLSSSTTNQSNCPRSSYEELKGQIFTNGIDFARISLNNKQVGKTPPPTKKKIKKSLNRGILQPLMYHEQHKWYTVKKIHVLIVESHTEYINFVSYISCLCQYIYYTIINKYFFFYTFWRKIFIRHKWKKKGASTTSEEKDNTMPNVRNQKKEPMYLKLLKIICSLHRLL